MGAQIKALHRRRAAWFAVLILGLLFIQAAYYLHGGGGSHAPAGLTGFAAVIAGEAPWSLYASLGLAATAGVGFMATHLELFRHGWYKGRQFLLVHPIFDIAIVLLIILLLIYTAVGLAR